MIKKYISGLVIVLSFCSKMEGSDLKTETSDNDRDKNGTTKVLFYENGTRISHFTLSENKDVESERSSYFDGIVENTPPQKDKLKNSPLTEKNKNNTYSKSPNISVKGKTRVATFDNTDFQKNNIHTNKKENYKIISSYQPVSKEKKNDKKLSPRRTENFIFQFEDEEELNSSEN